MKKPTLLLLALLAPLAAFAQKDYTGWHFPVGLTYSAGFKDVTDAVLRDVTGTDYVNIPVGLSFSPHRTFPSGVSVGADVGPFLFVMVQVKTSGYYGSTEQDTSALLAPLGAYVRYDFIKDGSASPYVRAGVRHVFVSGDLVDSGATGIYGSVGVTLSRNRRVNWGFEVGVDTTEIDVYRFNSNAVLTTRTESVKPYKFTVSAFVSF